jgi:DNA-binding CsgD family transcriptional regulator
VTGELPSPAQRAAELRITPREATVLMLLADGLTAAAIARRLSISPHTVTKHQENTYRKLGTSDRLTTILRAQEFGLVRRAPS